MKCYIINIFPNIQYNIQYNIQFNLTVAALSKDVTNIPPRTRLKFFLPFNNINNIIFGKCNGLMYHGTSYL